MTNSSTPVSYEWTAISETSLGQNPSNQQEPPCTEVLENTTVVTDLDCGTSNADLGKDLCVLRDKDANTFGEDLEKPSQITLTLGDTLTDEIDSTQGDKLEVGSVMPGDDGDGSYFILVSDDGDPSKTDKLYFSGDVEAGGSFTAQGIDGSFGSETFVHIFASNGGALLQTINFHTSCSAPLVIGDQYGSVSLAGAALEGKDSGTLYQVGNSGAAGDDGVIYSIVDGADAALFEVDPATGEVSFIDAPDYENPQDAGGDNNYAVVVRATRDDGTFEDKPLEVCVEDDCIKVTENTTVVTDLDCGTSNADLGKDLCVLRDKDANTFGEDLEKPSQITLTLGDTLTDEIDSTQGDKLEVGSVMPGDDGDGSYFILVSDDGDPSKTDKLYFSGDVEAGGSFTAQGIDGSFGSETFVHIFASNGGALLQTINFHTSCSAPLVIGDQYGSVSLAGAALEGKDSGTLYQVGNSGAAGDDGVIYSIVDGADAALFEVDPATGEVSFIDAPDYENPQDAGGDNNYAVVVRATRDDGTFEDKPLEVCVEDDCIKVTENTTVVTDLDCGTSNADLGKDLCVLRDKDANTFGEDLEKPSQITLTLGDTLTDEIDSTQGDKLEVGSVMPGDDGDGSYFILVSDDGDPSKTDKLYFSGDVEAGGSFTAQGIDGSFGSETFVHIFASNGGALLQTINFHTSCSAPLVIGDQYGSVSLAGAALEGKDSGTLYQVGNSGAAGDDGVIYSIVDGADAALFEVDPATGEVSFIDAPDYENPQDAGGDNNYAVVVRATRDDGTFEDKPLEVCVEDDCIKVAENTTAVIDLDCGSGTPTDVGLNACDIRDDKGYNKPSELTIIYNPDASGQNSQGDKAKLQGSNDDDDTAYIVIRAKDDGGNLYFQGAVSKGDAITFGPGVGDTLESNTYMAVYEDEAAFNGGSGPLQTIGLHTSCSAPIIIGESVGSVVISGFGFDAGGTLDSYGSNDGAGDAGVTYSIVGGADAALFEVDPATGEVSFIDAPDYENPQDAGGDNNYAVVVRATRDDGTFEDKPLEVCVEDDLDDVCIDENTKPVLNLDLTVVCPKEIPNPDLGLDICALTKKENNTFGEDTEKPGSYLLNLGELSSDLVTSDTTGKVEDKVEVGALTGTDDGDGSYFILVSRESDPSKTDKLFFSGDVQQGESFVASEDAFDQDFGSETFVHIFSSEGGSLLQTINFHTSCSSPLIIGDEYGSVSLQGASLEGKDSKVTYEVGGTEMTEEVLGEGDIFYSIEGGADAAFFTIDPDTGELSFINAPDFENPQDAGGDNVYDVVVRATAKSDASCFTEKPLEVCVEDVAEPGSLSGRYFCDTNDNDVDDGQGTDPGIAGVLVTLLDGAGNPVLDGGNPVTTTTGPEGVYSFTGLVAGSYGVRFTDPDEVLAGKQLVAPNDPDGNGDDTNDSDAIGDTLQSEILNISVTGGQNTPDNDAGAEYTASLGDRVFFDTDRDGIQDAGEAGVDGVTVTLTGGGADGVIGTGGDDTTTVATTVGGGLYLFEGLDPGTEYKVTFSDLPPGTEFTLADNETGPDGDDGDSDADPITGMTQIVTLAPGETNLSLDAGIVDKLGSLSGRYFCDTNDNDVDDGQGTDPGIAGVLVTLLDGAGNPVLDGGNPVTTTTGPEGVYSFTGLVAGSYGVRFTDPDEVLAGKQLVAPNDPDGNGDDTNDSDAIGDTLQSEILNISVTGGQNTPDNDAGAEYTASLGDRVFFDTDRDGIQDAGEAGVDGVTVTLTGGGADGVIGTGGDDTTTVATTVGGGLYLFEGLDPGTEYKVTFSDLPPGTEFTLADNETGPDGDDGDSDADPITGMTQIVTLAPGETNLSLDAGIVDKLGSLSGRYFCDTNDNDVDDGQGTDPGIAGVLVTLLDGAGNPVLDGGNPVTTTTGPEGVYSFTGLVAGSYGVRFTDPDEVLAGKQLVAPNDPDGNGDDTNDSDAIGDTLQSEILNISVTGGQNTPDNDAGAEYTASLGDRVFFDTDRDGIQDAGEAGVDGVTVTLTGGGADGVIGTGGDDTTTVATTVGGGLYLFEGLDPGTEYKVTFSDLPPGTEFTLADNETGPDGDDGDSDADPITGMTQIVTLAPGETNLSLDAGIVDKLGSLSGRYFCDTNDNDVDDGQGTDPGIAGVLVTLLDGAGNPVLDGGNPVTTTTGPEGVYSFTGLVAGSYGVRFTDPDEVLAGKQLVAPNDPDGNGDDTNDSDAIGDTLQSEILNISVTGGQNTPDNDAGAEYTASLGDRVFFDTDRDGIQDAGEAGVDGVTVTLTGGGADGVIGTGGDDTTTVATTVGGGLYLFEGLDPGTEYKVTFSDLPPGTEFTLADNETGPDGDDGDSDADPITGMTQIVTLAPGETNLSLDAGIVDKLGSLSGRYFCDTNDNDVDDGQGTDPGIAGVLVTLLDGAGNPVLDGGNPVTTTTGPEGVYSFTGLVAGSYGVRFTDPDEVLAGKQLVAPNDPDGNGDDTNDSDAIGDTLQSEILNISVTGGQNTPDNDAGAEYTASLGDRVFFDTDRDGIQDAGEAGVDGVTVTLTGGGADGVIGTGGDDTTTVATTVGGGLYLFEGLDPGTEYKVTFSDLPPGTEFTLADNETGPDGDDGDSDADPITGMTQIVTLAPGETNLSLDAGIVDKLGSLSGRYFCDTNDNDVDDGEPTDTGIAGKDVTLWNLGIDGVVGGGDDTVAATTTTDGLGAYNFTGIVGGTYAVQFEGSNNDALPKGSLANPDDSDADPLTGFTDPIAISGDTIADVDAGVACLKFDNPIDGLIGFTSTLAKTLPLSNFNNDGDTIYIDATDTLTITGKTLPVIAGTTLPEGAQFLLTAIVDDTGTFGGGDVFLFNDVNGDLSVDAGETVYVEADLLGLGASNAGSTDIFDFAARVTGGTLASEFGTFFGGNVTSEQSTFDGDFVGDFSGEAKGIFSGLDYDCICG